MMSGLPKSASQIDTTNFKCLRNAADGSMYYGEIAWIRRENGQLVSRGSAAYTTEVSTLPDEQRKEQFE